MKRISSLMAFLPLLLTGCSSALDGVWLFYVTVVPDTDDVCSDTITENFVDAYEPAAIEAEEDPWTATETIEGSEWIFTGLITSTGGDTATLMTGDQTYPGTLKEDDTWVFSWTTSTNSSDTLSHTDGYDWSESVDSTATTTFNIGTEGDDGYKGSLDGEGKDIREWTESDTWSEDIAKDIGYTGMIPASYYLVRENMQGDEVPAENTQEDVECVKEGLCRLSVTTTCQRTYTMRSVQTSLEEAEGYDGIDGAGQAPGI